MQLEKTIINIKRILFLIYHYGSVIIVTKKSQQIGNITIANTNTNLVFQTTPNVLFNLLYTDGYIELVQTMSLKRMSDEIAEYTRDYYALSEKGEDYMKFLYPEGK